MKKTILFAVTLLVSQSLVSCFSDDSTDAGVLADFEVSGIEEEYTKTSYIGEVLSISPTVVTDFADSDVAYEWMLLSDKTGSITEKGDTLQPTVISHEKNLSYDMNLAPGTYQLRFLVRNVRNGYTKISYTKLISVTEFSAGFYILKETADGRTDLDLYTSNGTTASDLLAKVKGESMAGKPYSLWVNYGQYYINPDDDQIATSNSITVITDQKQILTLRTSDLGTMFDRSSLLFGDMDANEQPYALIFHPMYGLAYLSTSGLRLANHQYSMGGAGESAGKFGMPVEATQGSKHVAVSFASFGNMNLWDEATHSIVALNYNYMPSPMTYDDFSGAELTQNLTGYECLSAGVSKVGSAETDNIILEETSTGQRYIYLMSNSIRGQYLTKRVSVPAGSHFAKAVHFATNGQSARYIYAAEGGKVWALNYDSDEYTEVEIPTPGIGSGETISYVANQFIAGSGSANFDYLIVGTQQAGGYKLYMYETVGGAPTTNPIIVTQGTGTLKCVRNVSPGASIANMAMFGTPVYPTND